MQLHTKRTVTVVRAQLRGPGVCGRMRDAVVARVGCGATNSAVEERSGDMGQEPATL